MRNHLLHLCFALFCLLSSIKIEAQVNLIFDTDFGGDADDLGALAMLNRFIDTGECKLLAITVWSQEKYAVPAIDAVNTFYKHPNIPIGVRKGNTYTQEWNYSRPIAEMLEHDLTQHEATDALSLFREVLANAEDKSITIVTVGPLANILNLINSPADSIVDRNGLDLLHQKVQSMVIMGGKFPEGEWEWNFNGDMPGVTNEVLSKVDIPIVFTGYEVGNIIKTGEVFNNLPPQHPLHIGFLHFSEHAEWIKDQFNGEILDNATYDQTAVYMAVRGGYETFWKKSENGICIADKKGANTWQSKSDGKHNYIILAAPPEKIASEIEQIMLHIDQQQKKQ